MLKIKEVANLAGISKRTLQYYDKIGLLSPFKTESGYRLYDKCHLDNLQQILFFRELDLPLNDISKVINDPSFDRGKALKNHRIMLKEKRVKIDKMLATIDKTLEYIEGGIEMNDTDKFQGFDFSSNNIYEEEARMKWGDKAIDKSNCRLNGKEKNISDEMNSLYQKLAEIRHLAPESDKVQDTIGEWFSLLNRIGTYSLEAFEGLGEMYVEDERFKNNIDKFGVGLASFMKEAMGIYAKNHL